MTQHDLLRNLVVIPTTTRTGEKTPQRQPGIVPPLASGVPRDVPLRYVGTALASLGVAVGMLIAWGPELVSPGGFLLPHALGVTHVMALGFATSLAWGVLYIFAPSSFHQDVPMPRLCRGIWWAYTISVVAFVLSFVTDHVEYAAVAGPCLAAAVLGFVGQIAVMAWRGRRRSAVTAMTSMAVAALALTAVLGSVLALNLSTGFLGNSDAILGAKIILAIGGWIALLIMGVSYHVVPMTNASHARGRSALRIAVMLPAALAGGAIAVALQLPLAVRVAVMVPAVAASSLYAADVVRFVRARHHPLLTPMAVGQVAGASLIVVDSLLALPAVSGISPWPQLAVTTALLGWVPVLILSNGLRMIPVVMWSARTPGERPQGAPASPARLGWCVVVCALTGWALWQAAIVTTDGLLARGAAAILGLTFLALLGIAAVTGRRLRRSHRAPGVA
jgi:hypothetical protein